MVNRFSRRSLDELRSVHPDLVRVVTEALPECPVDFGVHDGIRTAEEQRALFERGVSKLDGFRNRSKHQIQMDGYGHAVDLVPWIAGKLRWDPIDNFYPIAASMAKYADKAGIRIRWGATWSELLPGHASEQKKRVHQYAARRRKQGRRAFIDAAHFELI